MEESYFSFSPVRPDGCKGPQSFITVHPAMLEEPVITFEDGALHTDAAGEYQWMRNGNVISGADQNTFTPSTAGTYTVSVTAHGCSKISNEFIWTSIPEESPSAFTCEVFPTPSRGESIKVRLNSGRNAAIQIRISDILGNELMSKSLMPEEWRQVVALTDLNLKAGVYFVVAEQNGQKRVARIIVSQ